MKKTEKLKIVKRVNKILFYLTYAILMINCNCILKINFRIVFIGEK